MLVMVGALGLQIAHTVWTDRAISNRMRRLPSYQQGWGLKGTRMMSRQESLWTFVVLFAGLVVVMALILFQDGRDMLPAALISAGVFTLLHTVWMIRLRRWDQANSRRRAASVQVNSG